MKRLFLALALLCAAVPAFAQEIDRADKVKARLVAEGFIVREDGDALVADAMAEAPELLR